MWIWLGLDKLILAAITAFSTPVPCGAYIDASVRGEARVALCAEAVVWAGKEGP